MIIGESNGLMFYICKFIKFYRSFHIHNATLVKIIPLNVRKFNDTLR